MCSGLFWLRAPEGRTTRLHPFCTLPGLRRPHRNQQQVDYLKGLTVTTASLSGVENRVKSIGRLGVLLSASGQGGRDSQAAWRRGQGARRADGHVIPRGRPTSLFGFVGGNASVSSAYGERFDVLYVRRFPSDRVYVCDGGWQPANGDRLVGGRRPPAPPSRRFRIQAARGGGCLTGLIVAVQLADGAVPLPRLEPARRRTLILLGHEWRGILEEHVQAPTSASRSRCRTRCERARWLAHTMAPRIGAAADGEGRAARGVWVRRSGLVRCEGRSPLPAA